MIFCSQFKCRKELILFCIYFHFPLEKKWVSSQAHFRSHDQDLFWSCGDPPWPGNFHHVTWSHQAAMILRMSTRLFYKRLNIKGLMLLKGLSILEIYSDWTQACLIYIVWSTHFDEWKFNRKKIIWTTWTNFN